MCSAVAIIWETNTHNNALSTSCSARTLFLFQKGCSILICHLHHSNSTIRHLHIFGNQEIKLEIALNPSFYLHILPYSKLKCTTINKKNHTSWKHHRFYGRMKRDSKTITFVLHTHIITYANHIILMKNKNLLVGHTYSVRNHSHLAWSLLIAECPYFVDHFYTTDNHARWISMTS